MRYTAVLLMLMFTAVAVDAVAHADDRYLAEVKASGVNYIYSSSGKLTFIATKETTELVDALVAKKPDGLEVKVVVYSDTGNVAPGYKLEEK